MGRSKRKGRKDKEKERGRSPVKSDKAKRKGDKSGDKKKKKSERKPSTSSSSSSSSSEDALIGAEHKVAQAIAPTFGVKPKMLKFNKGIVRISDLSPYLIACVIAECQQDLTSQTVMHLGGELYEVGGWEQN